MSERGRTGSAWALVALASVAATALLWVVRLPTPALFGPLLVGLAWALLAPVRLDLPAPAGRLGQALLGATIGAVVSVDTLRRLGTDLLPVVLVTVGTLALSLLAGWLLALRRDVDLPTGVFAMIAGGASGVVAVSRELGADERVVAVVQYLRVLLILVVMPAVALTLPGAGAGADTGPASGPTDLGGDLLFVLLAVGGGLLLHRLRPVSAGGLLLPLAVAAVVAASGLLGTVAVPVWLQWPAYALIGVQVGLRFTRDSLRAITRMVPVVLGLILGLVLACAAMGALLVLTTDVDPLTAYLATTPGGLFAVLATAVDGDADATYVLTLQVVRLLAILLLMPFLARWLARHPRRG
ncbi:AbrB family transcriptional regulator [Nocardioides lentus]|uniref:AbrB family transcriptional regulator n=1 Tax=Nocardioides lentus TaxID=338077 RepID=A0ABN2P425_9ACTN